PTRCPISGEEDDAICSMDCRVNTRFNSVGDSAAVETPLSSTSHLAMDIRHWPFTKIILGCVAASLAAYYCRALNLGALELLRFVAGALALWVPIGGWLYLLLRNEVPDRIVRLSFSAGGSYALTTLFYFAAATLHCNWLFYSVEAVAG